MPPQYINAVYYPSWRVYRAKPPSSLQVNAITHVFYAFLHVQATGHITLLDEYGDVTKNVDGEPGCLGALAKLKRQNPHIKTLISVGGGSGSAEFPAMASSFEARFTFAREVQDFCDQYEFDGVDIDWEHPGSPSEGQSFVELLETIRQALPSPQYLLTTALPIGEYCLKNIDLEATARTLDFLNLMAYDFTGSWTEVAGHHAQLASMGEHPALSKSCTRGVEYVLSRKFPAHKIILGVPAYARFFPNASAPGRRFSCAGDIDYRDLADDWIEGAKVNNEAGAAAHVDEKGWKGFVSFDVPATVRMKAEFVKEKGLGGLFYWTGVGDKEGRLSLVASGYEALCG